MKKKNLKSLTLNKKTILQFSVLGGKNSPDPVAHSTVQGCQGTATRYPCSN
ncbi:hypothetical protein KORDIASMS9_03325 [Kordia sp. SMS9]|uniref:hypothetical protein n=1 Tax=Kordia sp. SMS9 TaxID=2282170 RepID=UPI000E10209F|nr:hypothetical protein [Kordia sp. SMS9]AXG71070.1 hypothetical protein KORDIASMS9_03325 [Kordia sp. SMS9]